MKSKAWEESNQLWHGNKKNPSLDHSELLQNSHSQFLVATAEDACFVCPSAHTVDNITVCHEFANYEIATQEHEPQLKSHSTYIRNNEFGLITIKNNALYRILTREKTTIMQIWYEIKVQSIIHLKFKNNCNVSLCSQQQGQNPNIYN